MSERHDLPLECRVPTESLVKGAKVIHGVMFVVTLSVGIYAREDRVAQFEIVLASLGMWYFLSWRMALAMQRGYFIRIYGSYVEFANGNVPRKINFSEIEYLKHGLMDSNASFLMLATGECYELPSGEARLPALRAMAARMPNDLGKYY